VTGELPVPTSARFAIGDPVRVLVGSKAGDHAFVEYVVWSERDHCHYFYLEQRDPVRKLSRGYRADELAAGDGPPPS
jgi:hypothetical protein